MTWLLVKQNKRFVKPDPFSEAEREINKIMGAYTENSERNDRKIPGLLPFGRGEKFSALASISGPQHLSPLSRGDRGAIDWKFRCSSPAGSGYYVASMSKLPVSMPTFSTLAGFRRELITTRF